MNSPSHSHSAPAVHPRATARLHLAGLDFAYGRGPKVCDGIGFSLAAGEIGCLLGPSGCGKTSALRLIAGLETPHAGEIFLDGEKVSAKGYALATEKRGIGMVFQDYALFPHLSVAANVGFGLGQLKSADRPQRVQEMLTAVGLANFADRYPHELSGGQKQRVALARALAPKPRLVLMDEPFASLDQEMRERLSAEVRQILKTVDATALIVTHDQHEAFAMADYIGVMNAGRLEQWDAAYDIYHRPATRFIADFVGQGVFLPGRVESHDRIVTELGTFEHCADCGLSVGERVDVLLRPDDLLHDDDSAVQAEVLGKAFRGAEFIYTLKLPSGETALSLVPSHHNHAIGERIGIKLDVDHVIAFRQGETGARASYTSVKA
jgi:iron(III) transport system ATP-binding protein